jgi:hypothetical protein
MGGELGTTQCEGDSVGVTQCRVAVVRWRERERERKRVELHNGYDMI